MCVCLCVVDEREETRKLTQKWVRLEPCSCAPKEDWLSFPFSLLPFNPTLFVILFVLPPSQRVFLCCCSSVFLLFVFCTMPLLPDSKSFVVCPCQSIFVPPVVLCKRGKESACVRRCMHALMDTMRWEENKTKKS